MVGVFARVTLLAAAFGLAGCSARTDLIDFASLVRSESPNDALACPTGLCAAKVDFITPTLDVSAADLAAKVRDLIPQEPRTILVSGGAPAADGSVAFVFVQRSLVFRFPATVHVLVRPVDASHATIAIYSRSNYGRGDFGVNTARVKTWLGKLGIVAAQIQ